MQRLAGDGRSSPNEQKDDSNYPGPRSRAEPTGRSDSYKWVALSNTTIGVLLATIDSSIMMIAMPDIFRGIHLDPLKASNSFYLLWLILGFLVVSSVLVVSLGRLGDLYGRVKMYNLGFVVYTASSLLLTIDWMTGQRGALWLLVWRIFQGIGSAFLMGNSSAILTDAFPSNQRGLALGVNNIAAISGTFIGLILGGILGPIDWRLVFLVSVPFGLFGTVWAYLRLRELGVRTKAKIDWPGNISFAVGLVAIMIGITYGIQPVGHHVMGWGGPKVDIPLAIGVACLAAFVVIELRVKDPMFRLPLFRIRAFTLGTLSSFLASVARGGLMFMMIIWLQGIWLPQHGYSFEETPLWAGIYMLPLTVGFLTAGPLCGFLSDRFGARPFATGGMLGATCSFLFLTLLPINFTYWQFGLVLLFDGFCMGTFASPNRAGIMNSLPAQDRGAGGGMSTTFQNSAQVLSVGIFFTLMIMGLASVLPTTMAAGLRAHGVPVGVASHIAHYPPVTILFAAFLGYNPVQQLLGPKVLRHLTSSQRHVLTGHAFFPRLISDPFRSGLHEAFAFAMAACLVAAIASAFRGKRYIAPAGPGEMAEPARMHYMAEH